MSDDDTTQVDDDPTRWPKIVDTLQGLGPTPPASVTPRDVHHTCADLEILGWSVRPAAGGGWFCWRESGTEFCREIADLKALARRAKREFNAQCKAEGKSVRDERKALTAANSIGTPTNGNARRDQRTAMKRDFLDFLARQLARVTVRRDDQQVGGPT